MSQTVLHWRLGDAKGQGSLSAGHRALFLALAFVHTVVPGVYRVHSGDAFFGSTWYDEFVSGGNWVCIPAVYLFLSNLGRACMGYHQLAVRLSNVTLVADASAAFEARLPFFLDLRQPANLEYWLALRERAKEVDASLIGMVAGAVVMDGLLLLVAVIRVLFYHKGVDLFNVLSITDIVLYSLFIVAFLLIVVQANTRLSVDHLQLIQRIRHQLSIDMCNGPEWRGLTQGLDEDDERPVDTWSDLDTFEAEDEDERKAEDVRAVEATVADAEDGAAAPHTASPALTRRASAKSASCPHGLPWAECMTCALQSHTSSLHARQSARLQGVQALLHSLHSHSVHHSSHDRVACGYFRYDVGAQLLDATVNHLTFLDEPVKLLGLVVTQQLVMQVLAAIATGGASALSTVVPSTASN